MGALLPDPCWSDLAPAWGRSQCGHPRLYGGRILAIAGSDSGGGAGIQADIKTITCLGGYAMTAVTALTVQDTCGVHAVHPTPPAIVAAQIACVLADPGVDVVKTGMLADAATIDAVEAALAAAPRLPLVVDPVMVATSGDRLLQPDAVSALRRLLARAVLATPNLPEAAALCGVPVGTVDQMRHAADLLMRDGAAAVLLKGGHLPGTVVTDLLVTGDGSWHFEHPRLPGTSTHGTGCNLASAVATLLAQGVVLAEAVERAILYVQAAILAAPGLGRGHGPVNHAVTVVPFLPTQRLLVARTS